MQEQLGWRDRLFLTAALRSDDASAFGSGFNRVTYPKYSVSYVISDEPWFKVPVLGNRLSSLRLRAAYGEAGKAPSTYSALRTYGSASGPGDTPAVTPLFIGNPNLGPERGKEIELGFDASMLDDRLGIEYTYYNKKTVDAILNRQIAPSTGIPSTQPFNAGAIRNWGNELQVRANPLRTRNANLDLTFNFANNDNRVLALFDTVSFVSSGSFTRQAIGYDAFGFWERHVTGAKLDANGKLILSTLMCSNGKGGQVQCAGADNAFGTADDAPLVYLGRSVPPHEGSIAANLGLWSRFHVSTFVDFKQGHKKIDGNTRVALHAGHRQPVPREFLPARLRSDHDRADAELERGGFPHHRRWLHEVARIHRVVRRPGTLQPPRQRVARDGLALGPQPAHVDQVPGLRARGDVARRHPRRQRRVGADPDPAAHDLDPLPQPRLLRLLICLHII